MGVRRNPGPASYEFPSLHRPNPQGWEDTKLYKNWHKSVASGRPNDLVVAVSASSKTGVSGTGKTTCAISLAEEFDLTDEGFDAEARGTTELSELAYDILPNAPEGSAIVLEEAQGTASGSGLNKRRGMKSETLDTINGILANRDNRYTLIIVVQQLSMLDTSLVPVIDAWLMIRHEPDDPMGPLAKHHEVYGEDYDLRHEDLKTPVKETLQWPELDPANDNYAQMEVKKQRAKRRDGGDDGDDNTSDQQAYTKQDLPADLRNDIIREHWEQSDDVTQKEVADRWDITQQRVQQIVNEDG